MHLTTPFFHHEGVPELVYYLEEWIDQGHQQDVLERQHLISEVIGKIRPVHEREYQRKRHGEHPDHQHRPAQQRTDKRHGGAEKAVGVEQWNTHEHRRADSGKHSFTPAGGLALFKIGNIR